MCSGRFVDVGQGRVLVAHEAVEGAAAQPQQPKPRMPDVASTIPPRFSSTRAVARSGPAGVEAERPSQRPVRNLDRRTCTPSTCGRVRELLAEEAAVVLRGPAREASVSRWMKFFIESVATRPVLSPVV